jgi:hypothetical protein
MSLTVIAHFIDGQSTPFPASIKDIGGEGMVFVNPQFNEGGVIVTSYDTEDIDMLVSSFKEHLKDNGLTLLCIHKINDKTVCYSETTEQLF